MTERQYWQKDKKNDNEKDSEGFQGNYNDQRWKIKCKLGQKDEQTERQKQKEDIQDSEGFQVDFSYEPIWTKMNN